MQKTLCRPSIHSKKEQITVEDTKGPVWIGVHAQRHYITFIWALADACFAEDFMQTFRLSANFLKILIIHALNCYVI